MYKKSHEPGLIPTSFLSSPSPTSTFTFSFNLHFQGPVPLSQPSFLSESRPGVACFVFSLRFKTTLSFLELSTTIFILTQTQKHHYKTPPKWFACLLPLSSLVSWISAPFCCLQGSAFLTSLSRHSFCLRPRRPCWCQERRKW